MFVLKKGPQDLAYIVDLFFPNNILKMIGLVIVESHLLKLKNEGKIERKGNIIKKI